MVPPKPPLGEGSSILWACATRGLGQCLSHHRGLYGSFRQDLYTNTDKSCWHARLASTAMEAAPLGHRRPCCFYISLKGKVTLIGESGPWRP